MIYNLVKYITNNTSLTIVANGFNPTTPDTAISVNEGSGIEQPFFDRKDTVVQCVSRAMDKTESRANAYTIYNLIKKKYALTLPEVTVNSVVYSAVTGWGLRPVGTPSYAYDDDSGRSVYTFSVEVTTT
jgi:hypothetical protein